MFEIDTPLTKEECRAWIAALRSGDYPQTRGKLHRQTAVEVEGDEGFPAGYCCLGVLGKLCSMDLNRSYTEEYLNSRNNLGGGTTWFKLNRLEQEALAIKNDEGASFKEIADYIETKILPTLK